MAGSTRKDVHVSLAKSDFSPLKIDSSYKEYDGELLEYIEGIREEKTELSVKFGKFEKIRTSSPQGKAEIVELTKIVIFVYQLHEQYPKHEITKFVVNQFSGFLYKLEALQKVGGSADNLIKEMTSLKIALKNTFSFLGIRDEAVELRYKEFLVELFEKEAESINKDFCSNKRASYSGALDSYYYKICQYSRRESIDINVVKDLISKIRIVRNLISGNDGANDNFCAELLEVFIVQIDKHSGITNDRCLFLRCEEAEKFFESLCSKTAAGSHDVSDLAILKIAKEITVDEVKENKESKGSSENPFLLRLRKSDDRSDTERRQNLLKHNEKLVTVIENVREVKSGIGEENLNEFFKKICIFANFVDDPDKFNKPFLSNVFNDFCDVVRAIKSKKDLEDLLNYMETFLAEKEPLTFDALYKFIDGFAVGNPADRMKMKMKKRALLLEIQQSTPSGDRYTPERDFSSAILNYTQKQNQCLSDGSSPVNEMELKDMRDIFSNLETLKNEIKGNNPDHEEIRRGLIECATLQLTQVDANEKTRSALKDALAQMLLVVRGGLVNRATLEQAKACFSKQAEPWKIGVAIVAAIVGVALIVAASVLFAGTPITIGSVSLAATSWGVPAAGGAVGLLTSYGFYSSSKASGLVASLDKVIKTLDKTPEAEVGDGESKRLAPSLPLPQSLRSPRG